MSTRREILAGLAAAPALGLPAVAAATAGVDPVLAAIAEWRILEATADADAEALERIESVLFAETEALGPDKSQFIMRRDLDRLYSFYGVVPELEALQARIDRNSVTLREIKSRIGLDAASEKAGASGKAAFEAMCRVLTIEPTTAEGAFALLDYTAFYVEDSAEFAFDDERATAPARAIRAALRVLRAQMT